jgi:hypothetical protein
MFVARMVLVGGCCQATGEIGEPMFVVRPEIRCEAAGDMAVFQLQVGGWFSRSRFLVFDATSGSPRRPGFKS